jgi:hypothetical protein
MTNHTLSRDKKWLQEMAVSEMGLKTWMGLTKGSKANRETFQAKGTMWLKNETGKE